MNLLYNTLHQPYKLKTGNWERQEITSQPQQSQVQVLIMPLKK